MSAGSVDRAVSQPGPRTGRILADKYRLLGKLGEGGMGEVYAAEHTFVGRRFAVKFLLPELTRDEQIMSRFRREAQAAGSLENENVVAVTDFGYAEDGAPFMVMEYLTGEDLRSLLVRTGRLSVKRAVELVIQACRGLFAAHARSVVHRDLKPENLFITKRGDGSDLLKILDFGIAKLRGQPASAASTKAGTVIGTLLYMPPEQVRGEKDTDHRADIYALGAILYEALSGSVPHPGDEAHTIMFHILYQQPAPLGSLRPELPPELVAVVHRALATDPAERFDSVASLSEALAPFSGRVVTPLEGTTAQLVATMPAAPGSMSPQTSSETERALKAAGLSQPNRPGKRAWVWVVLAVLLAGAAYGVLTLREEPPARPVVQPSEVPAAPVAPPLPTAPKGAAAGEVHPSPARVVAPPSAGSAAEAQVLPAPSQSPIRAAVSKSTPPRRARAANAARTEPPEPVPVPASPQAPPPRPRPRVQVDRNNPYE